MDARAQDEIWKKKTVLWVACEQQSYVCCSQAEAYNPEAYNSVAKLGFFREPIKIYFLVWNYW